MQNFTINVQNQSSDEKSLFPIFNLFLYKNNSKYGVFLKNGDLINDGVLISSEYENSTKGLMDSILSLDFDKYKVTQIKYIKGYPSLLIFHYLSQSGAYKGMPLKPFVSPIEDMQFPLFCNQDINDTLIIQRDLNPNESLSIEFTLTKI